MAKYENLLQTKAELCQQLLKNEEKIIKHQILINKLNTDNTIIIKNDNLSNIKTIIKLLKPEENLPQQLIIADKKEVITENTPKAEIDKINLLDLQNKILNVDQLKFSPI